MERRSSKLVWTIITIIVLIALAAWAFTWLGNRDSANEAVEETSNAVNSATDNIDNDLLSRIIDNPSDYYGQEVTVNGEIQDVYERRVFKISDQTVGDELLVITKRPLTASQINEAEEFFEDNADVRATGLLRLLVVTEIESEYDLDLTEELEIEFRDRPVLIADNFSFSDNKAIFDFNQGP